MEQIEQLSIWEEEKEGDEGGSWVFRVPVKKERGRGRGREKEEDWDKERTKGTECKD